jgi:hypothetical protein
MTQLSKQDYDIFTQWTPKDGRELPPIELVLDEFLMYMQTPQASVALRKEFLELYYAKAALYTDDTGVDSCLKRGLHGLFHNIMRKVDRIENVGIKLGVSGGADASRAEAQQDNSEPETLYVTVRDMVLYGVHLLRWLQAEEIARAAQTTAK